MQSNSLTEKFFNAVYKTELRRRVFKISTIALSFIFLFVQSYLCAVGLLAFGVWYLRAPVASPHVWVALDAVLKDAWRITFPIAVIKVCIRQYWSGYAVRYF